MRATTRALLLGFGLLTAGGFWLRHEIAENATAPSATRPPIAEPRVATAMRGPSTATALPPLARATLPPLPPGVEVVPSGVTLTLPPTTAPPLSEDDRRLYEPR